MVSRFCIINCKYEFQHIYHLESNCWSISFQIITLFAWSANQNVKKICLTWMDIKRNNFLLWFTIIYNFPTSKVLKYFSSLKSNYKVWFSENEFKKSAKCIASFLLFEPKDTTMIRNKSYFKQELKLTEFEFQARKEAETYYNQVQNEKLLMEFIDESFQFESEETSIHDEL